MIKKQKHKTMTNQKTLFSDKQFLPIFITQVFGAFNDNMLKNALLIWFTYHIATKEGINPSMMVTFAAAIFILPFFLFSFLAGQIADKYEKAYLVRRIKIIEIFLVIFASIGFYFEHLNLLLFLLFLMGSQSAFFGPLKYSLLPALLTENKLLKANGYVEAGTFLAILLGTLLGAIVILAKNNIVLISIILISCGLIGCLASWNIPKTKINDPNLKLNFNIYSTVMNMIHDAKRDFKVWLVIILISWFWMIGSVFLTLFPLYSKNLIMGQGEIVSLFLAIFSIGIAIGSLSCNKILKGKIDPNLAKIGNILLSLTLLFFIAANSFYQSNVSHVELIELSEFLAPNIYSYCIIFSLLAVSISAGIYIVPLYALMQKLAPKKIISRIIALNNILNAFFMVTASLLLMLFFKLELSFNQIFFIFTLTNLIFLWIIKSLTKLFFSQN